MIKNLPPMPEVTGGMPRAWDERFAEAYAAMGPEYGLHIEQGAFVDSYVRYGTEGHAYAVILGTEEAEAILAHMNERGAENFKEAQRHLSPLDLASDAFVRYQPVSNLGWNEMIEHPNFRAGRTRQEALIMAREAHMHRELRQKARALSRPALREDTDNLPNSWRRGRSTSPLGRFALGTDLTF